jgi:hypothetical protein
MKRIIAFLVCILVGFGMGWYYGYTRPTAKDQRAILNNQQYFKAHLTNFDAAVADFKQRESKISVAAKPWETASASVALMGLKDLETNDMAGAKYRLAELVGLYYRPYSHDANAGTNLFLREIAAFAAKDVVLSNEIYGKQ